MSLFRFGNLKLPTTTAIFNLSPTSNGRKGAGFRMVCGEYTRGHCQLPCPRRQCYTIKAERRFPAVVRHRQNQQRFWARCTPRSFVARFNGEKRATTGALRFGESGGISTVADIRKIAGIARLLPGIAVYLYTARIDLWKRGAFDCLPDNVCVSGSGFMAHNRFQWCAKGAVPADAFQCPANCRVCDVCTKRQGLTIYGEDHT